MKIEKGDLHFMIFTILVGSIFVFMISGMHYESGHVVSENTSHIMNLTEIKEGRVYESFCYQYNESDEEYDDYNGYCELYYGGIVGTNGVIVSLEYVGYESAKLNMNGKLTNEILEDENVGKRVKEGRVEFKIREILAPGKNDFPGMVSFYYILSWDKPVNFCEGIYCTLEVGSELTIDEHEIEFKSFCTDRHDCDLMMEVDSEEYELKGLYEGSLRKLGNLTIEFVEFDISDQYMKFKHSYRSSEPFCNESDRGLDFFNNGSIEGFFRNESFFYGEEEVVPFVFDDYCLEFSEKLVEFYCGKDEYLSYEVFECAGECLDGKCIEEVLEEVAPKKEDVVVEEEVVIENERSTNYTRDSAKVDLYKEKKEDKSLLGKFFSWIGGFFG